MQPPPRKAKVTQEVRCAQTEQLARLTAKHQQESDLLEDIRSFCKQRAAIEKDYGQGLQKLSSQFLRREWSVQEPEGVNNSGSRSAFAVWRLVLLGTLQAANSRLVAAESYRSRVAEPAKAARAARDAQLKKCSDRLVTLQAELADTVKELEKAKKRFSELERLSNQTRGKSGDTESWLKRSEFSSLFHSKASLQKANARMVARRKECHVKLRQARNEYVISVAGANAHQQRHASTDIPALLSALDGDVYERLCEYFCVLGQTELESCQSTQEPFVALLQAAHGVSREHDLKLFLRENAVVTELPPFCAHTGDDAGPELLGPEEGAEEVDQSLDKEARKWASKVARDHKVSVHAQWVLQELEGQIAGAGGPGGVLDPAANLDLEAKMEEARESIRKAETDRLKAAACLSLLRRVGVDVDLWLDGAMTKATAELESERRASEARRNNGELSPTEELSLGGYYDGEEFESDTLDESGSSPSGTWRQYPQTCRVLYSYQANMPDELTIDKDEMLEIIEDGDMEDWVKGRNAAGKVGYVPEKYLQPLEPGGGGGGPGGGFGGGGGTGGLRGSTSADVISYTSGNSIEPELPTEASLGVWLARALYDYEAQTEDELSFPEGAIIRILHRGGADEEVEEGDVDDGFWKGELNGRVGLFPSLVVEEMNSGAGAEGSSGGSRSPDEERRPSPLSPAAGLSRLLRPVSLAHSGPPSPEVLRPTRPPRPASAIIAGSSGCANGDIGGAFRLPPVQRPSLRPVRAAPPPPTKKAAALQDEGLEVTLV
ncbi:F-BAR and double SH3 domains protein 2-like [Petromyzon marinus]|uniref:F-BAR and double SH3 domains protein 2-like n=1 Tax=Petromyzon marinus TaxID=7757 RepID=A0AAJ7WVN5_PETMA|nr:F-BAR and double SH3 domains protein 2-like [Petromyzon marinus]